MVVVQKILLLFVEEIILLTGNNINVYHLDLFKYFISMNNVWMNNL